MMIPPLITYCLTTKGSAGELYPDYVVDVQKTYIIMGRALELRGNLKTTRLI
jgi:hypothetical protein